MGSRSRSQAFKSNAVFSGHNRTSRPVNVCFIEFGLCCRTSDCLCTVFGCRTWIRAQPAASSKRPVQNSFVDKAQHYNISRHSRGPERQKSDPLSDHGSPAIHGRSREIVIRCRHKTARGLVMWARSRHDLDFKMLVYRRRSCSRLCIREAPPREIGANIGRTILGGSGHLILVTGDILQVQGHCMTWDRGEFGRRRPCPGREKTLDQS